MTLPPNPTTSWVIMEVIEVGLDQIPHPGVIYFQKRYYFPFTWKCYH